jgi:hypothetical protein
LTIGRYDAPHVVGDRSERACDVAGADSVAAGADSVSDKSQTRAGRAVAWSRPADLVSPSGTDASLLELVVGFFVAVSLIAVLTMILRRRGGRQDLLGTQVREMEERTAAATAPEPDTRLHEAATRVADARVAESRVAEGRGADARVADAQLKGAASRAPATAPADAAPIAGADAIDVDATSAAAATTADATSATARAVTADAASTATARAATAGAATTASTADATSAAASLVAADAAGTVGIADATSAVAGSAAAADVLASGVRAVDATAPPDGWPVVAGGKSDALVDAFAWLRIAALVEAGQREQAVELLSATMGISVEEAEMLVDGLNEAGGERRPD